MKLMNQKNISHVLYLLTGIAACLPVIFLQVLSEGDVLYWLARIEELAEGLAGGRLLFYPSLELVSIYGGKPAALDTNLWLLPAALLRNLGISSNGIYLIYMLFVQLGTLITCFLLFRKIFNEELPAAFGVLLYMTCPYRLWLCYDKADFLKAVVWLLLPFFAWGLLTMKEHLALGITAAALSFAGMGYAWGMMVLILSELTVIVSVLGKTVKIWIPVAAGAILFLPGSRYLFQYLLLGGMEPFQLSLQPIAWNGYTLGQFFSSFVYKDGMPGLGLGLMTALLAFIWFQITGQREKFPKIGRIGGIVGILFLCISLQIFPWDTLQRINGFLLRMIPLLETPGTFFGLAAAVLTIPGAYAVKWSEDNPEITVRTGIPIMIFAAAISVNVVLLNMWFSHTLN